MSDRFNTVREAVPEHPNEEAPTRRSQFRWRNILGILELDSVARFGWLPTLSIVMALGLVLIAIGCSLSRMDENWAQLAFWLGFLTLTIPASIRLCMEETGRRERILILAMMALGYYLIKVFYSPSVFNLNDELQHWRSTANVLQTHQLFQPNPTLQVSAYFPGLESAAGALINLSGLSIFQAGIIMIGFAFITIPVILFLLFERISHSSLLAGVASLIYFANPSYLLGYSQFAYESMAVPLAFTTIYLLATRVDRSTQDSPPRVDLAILLLLSSVVITHHVTSYVLAGVLSLWAFIALLRWRPEEKKFTLVGFALIAVAWCILWVYASGNNQLVIGYIEAPIIQAVNGMVGIITGKIVPRTFFQNPEGIRAPLWMQIPSYLSVLVISISILLGLLVLMRKSKVQSLAITLGIISLGYFVAQATRVSSTGLVMTDRIASIVFFPVSFVAAHAIVRAVQSIRSPSMTRLWRPIANIGLCLMLVGTATAVVANRELPGPYKPHVFTRDIGTLGIATAGWAKDQLGPDHRFGSDFISMLIMGSYGNQQVVTEENGFFAETTVFASPKLNDAEIGYLVQRGVEYLVIDNNLENKLVLPPQTSHPASYFTSLDGMSTVSRIYDSGSITIYHLGFVSPSIQITKISSNQP